MSTLNAVLVDFVILCLAACWFTLFNSGIYIRFVGGPHATILNCVASYRHGGNC